MCDSVIMITESDGAELEDCDCEFKRSAGRMVFIFGKLIEKSRARKCNNK